LGADENKTKEQPDSAHTTDAGDHAYAILGTSLVEGLLRSRD